MTRAPIREPAKTIAPVETIVPSPIVVGGSGSRFAVERGEGVGCLPTTAPSSTFDALAEDGALVDHPRSRWGWISAHGGSVSRSSARTTIAPSSATARRSPSPAIRSRNAWHSSRSGSAVSIFGMWMSPVRVCHSP